MPKDIKSLVGEFLDYILAEKGHSELTEKKYRQVLGRFLEFSQSRGAALPHQITPDLVKDFRRELGSQKEIGRKTLNYYLIALRSFLKFLGKEGIKSLSPEQIELGDFPEPQITFLEQEELNRLFEAVPGKDKVEIRNRAILEVLFSTGLRVAELVSLKQEDLNLKRGEISALGKGGKRRVVFLSDQAKGWLDKYLKIRTVIGRGSRQGKNPPIFVSESEIAGQAGRSLSTRQVERIVKAAARAAGLVKKVTPHTMRHSFGTDMLAGGADIRSVQTMLGHASITTTQIYTHITNPRLREIHKKYHDRSGSQSKSEKENSKDSPRS